MNNSLPVILLLLAGTVAGCGLSGKNKSSLEIINDLEVYCISKPGLTEVKSAIDRDDATIQASYQKLLEQAELALVAGPFTVMNKNKIPPSGDKHDYFSIPPYRGTGDGLTNPEWWLDYDRVPLEQMTQSVETLALVWLFTGENKYADQASLLLRTWFISPETRMNPDLEFAQARPRTGVIDTRFFPRIIDAIGILRHSGTWTQQDQAAMQAWCEAFLMNVESRVDEAHRASGHNISSWYHVQMASMALFIGDMELAGRFLNRTRARIDTAINADGGFKRELHRTRSLSYSCFHSFAIYNLATMGELTGNDLWNYRTEDGRGFELGLEYIAKHAGPHAVAEWPFSEIDGAKGDWWEPRHDMLPVVLYHAAMNYENEQFRNIAEDIMGDQLDEYRIQLMCGLPLRWVETIDPVRK